MIRVCSGFAPSGRLQYGERFLRAFDRYWPKDVQLLVYVEEPTPMPREAERILWTIPGALEFQERHAGNLAAQGRVPQACWKHRERFNGYSFRNDALKFWKQILIPEAAANDPVLGPLADGDLLVWLDGDVETLRPVPPDLVSEALAGAEICYLGRERGHSEIGFWAVRINPRTRAFLAAIADQYRSDAVFELPEWHSAFAWDHVRRSIDPPLAAHDLCAQAKIRAGHVWPYTMLAPYMRHDKGARKKWQS